MGVATSGPDRRANHRLGDHAQSHGLRRHCRAATGSGALHLFHSSAGLCPARHLPPPQRLDLCHAGHHDLCGHQPRSPWRQHCRVIDGSRHLVRSGGRFPDTGRTIGPWRGGQPDFRTGTDRLQGRCRTDCDIRPDPQTAGPEYRKSRLFPGCPEHYPIPSTDLADHPAAISLDVGPDTGSGIFRTQGTGSAHHRDGRDRSLGAVRTGRYGRLGGWQLARRLAKP